MGAASRGFKSHLPDQRSRAIARTAFDATSEVCAVNARSTLAGFGWIAAGVAHAFAGESGDACRIARDGAHVELRSPSFVFALETSDGLRAASWENLATGEKLALGGGAELAVDLGELGEPHTTPNWKVESAPKASETSSASGSAAFELASSDGMLAARVTYDWNASEPVLHKHVRITSRGAAGVRLLDLRLGDYRVACPVVDREQGFPVHVDGQFFMSVAHPAGWATARDGEISLRQYPGAKLAAGASFDSMEAIYGVAARERSHEAFAEHVRSRMRRVVRGHDRPYAIYDNFGSWPSGIFANSEAYELKSLGLLAESQRATGCRFDLCNIHFWVDSAGDMKRWDPTRFPNGIAKIKPILDSLGTAPGLWIGSACTWGDSWSIGPNPATAPSRTLDPGWFCRASEPIRSMFRDAFVEHIQKDGVRLLKFDEFHSSCDNPAHAHLPGVYSTEAIDDAVIDFLRELDRASPDVFVMLYWGYRSPWWLLYADTLFDSGLGIEAASPSAQPSLFARDSVTQKLDQSERFASDVPALGKDSLGVWLSSWGWNSSIGKERWQAGFAMDLCRGSELAQIWADEDWLSPDERRELADFIALLRAEPKCFANPRFVIGDASRDEPYGYCCSDGRRAIVAANNCTWSDRTVELELNSKWGLPDDARWELYRVWPNPARLTGDAATFGANVELTLRPFEVDLVEVVPAGERPSLDRAWPSDHIPTSFEVASRDLVVRAIDAPTPDESTDWRILRPTRATAAGGATLAISADGSILASGTNAPRETYTVVADADADLDTISAIQLELLPDPSLPAGGPGRAINGNFALTDFRATASSTERPGESKPVVFRRALASYSQTSFGGWSVGAAIDHDTSTGWSIDPFEGESHTAIFELEEPVKFAGGTRLAFTLEQFGPPQHALGRFRLWATSALIPLPAPASKDRRHFALQVEVPASQRRATLAITAELSRDGAPLSLRDIGSYFDCSAKLGDAELASVPVLGNATYPSTWQAWRIALPPSNAPRTLHVAVGAALPLAVRLSFRAHFCP